MDTASAFALRTLAKGLQHIWHPFFFLATGFIHSFLTHHSPKLRDVTPKIKKVPFVASAAVFTLTTGFHLHT